MSLRTPEGTKSVCISQGEAVMLHPLPQRIVTGDEAGGESTPLRMNTSGSSTSNSSPFFVFTPNSAAKPKVYNYNFLFFFVCMGVNVLYMTLFLPELVFFHVGVNVLCMTFICRPLCQSCRAMGFSSPS